MAKSPLRYKRLLKEIPKHEHAQDALIAAGFSKQTARTQSKRVLKSALEYHAKELTKPEVTSQLTSAQLMAEIVGLTRADVMDRLKTIATQDKDLHSALKVLIPLARQLGVSLDESENVAQTPILNVVVAQNDGLTEPPIDGNVVE